MGWDPEIDPCCNSIGTNALAPLYYYADEDALKQVEKFKGMRIVCNPAFPLAENYILMLEAVKEAEPLKTKAALILPEHETDKWFISFIERNKWRVVRRYPIGVKLFSEPSHSNGFSVKRRQPVPSVENIVAFELKTPNKEKCEGITLRE